MTKQMKLLKNFLNHFLMDTKLNYKHQREIGNLFLIVFIYCKCHKINFKRDGSYIDSPDWIKNKKATAHEISNKCFQYAVTVALNQE